MKITKACLTGTLLGLILVLNPALKGRAETTYPEKELAEALAKFKSTFSSFEEGRKLFAKGDAVGAARCFQSCTRSLPRHIYAHYYLANILYVQQGYSEALQAIEKAEDSIAFMTAMDAFARREKGKEFGKIRKSIEEYYESTNSCRERRELEQMYGQVEDEQDKADRQAAEEKLRWRRLRSHYAYFHGNVLFQLKEYDRADERFRKAIQEDSQNGYAYNNIAAIRYLARRFEEAERFLREAEEAGVDDMINLKLKKLVLEALGKPTEGILEQEYRAEGEDKIRVVRFTGNVYEGESNRLHLFAHCYIVFDRESGDALLLDPGRVDPRIETYIRENNLNVRLILNTHGHFDHTHGNDHYAGLFGAQIAAHALEAPLYAGAPEGHRRKPDVDLTEGTCQVCTIRFQIFHTPGHTPGSVCFLIGPFLISGDSLFADSIGKMSAADDADYNKKREGLIQILRKIILSLPPETQVLPGHGKSTTLTLVREMNPSFRKN
jgi:glyoxylase-like metal-dependent hydrolase (beta-lactamase superfamily II)